jgi:hypothetical protein
MANSVIFKFGSSLDGKVVSENDFIAINKGIAEGGDKRFGSMYKGDKILGTTEADKLYTTAVIGQYGMGTSIQDVVKNLDYRVTDITKSTVSSVIGSNTISVDSSDINNPTLSVNVKPGSSIVVNEDGLDLI